jgi:hypothetical protein
MRRVFGRGEESSTGWEDSIWSMATSDVCAEVPSGRSQGLPKGWQRTERVSRGELNGLRHRHRDARGSWVRREGLSGGCCWIHAWDSRIPRPAGAKHPAPHRRSMLVRVTTANGCDVGAAPIDFTSRRDVSPDVRRSNLSASLPGTSSALRGDLCWEPAKSVGVLLVAARRWDMTRLKCDFPSVRRLLISTNINVPISRCRVRGIQGWTRVHPCPHWGKQQGARTRRLCKERSRSNL